MGRRWSSWLAGSITAAAVLAGAPAAIASTFTVDTTSAAEGAGKTTLTDAINEANTAGGTNTINFTAGLGTVLLPATGLPVITDPGLKIDGCANAGGSAAGGCQKLNAGAVTDADIVGSGVFDVNAANVVLTGLNIDDSNAGDNNSGYRLIYAEAAATDLTITYDTLSDGAQSIVPAIQAYSDGLVVGGLNPSTHQPLGGVTVTSQSAAIDIEAGSGDTIEGSSLGVQDDNGIYLSGDSAKIIANTITIPSVSGSGFFGVQVDSSVLGAQIGDSTLQAPPNHITGFDSAVYVQSGGIATFYDNTGTASGSEFYLLDSAGVAAPTITSASGTITGTAADGASVEVIGSNTPGPPGGATELDGVLATVTASGTTGEWNWSPPSGQALPPYVTAIASLPAEGSSQTANWHQVRAALTVTEAGTGSGTVASQPAGISCPGTCSETESVGTKVTLTAAAGAGSVFTGWSGGGCSGTGTCLVTLSGATAVTATFTRGVTLTVATPGATQYNDYVTSSPAGIECGDVGGATCSLTVAFGTPVTLTATDNAPAGTIFAGWGGGGCSGLGTCTVFVTGNLTVTANYAPLPPSPANAVDIAPLFWAGPYEIADGDLFPYAVSCPSVSLCLATGQDFYEGFGNSKGAIATSTSFGANKTWQTGELDGNNLILSISCPTTTFCAAGDDGGDVLTSTDPAGGASKWTVTHVDSNQPVVGISCATPSNCVGVDGLGNAVISTNPTGGSGAWSVKAIDYPNGLNAISCPALGTCVATDNTGQVLVAIGSSATNTPASASTWNPTMVDQGNAINHISCVQALCAATDSAGNVITTTDVTGGASAWKVAHLSDKAMNGISCPSTTFCTTGSNAYQSYSSSNPTGGASAWHGAAVWMKDVSCAMAPIHGLGGDTFCVSITSAGWTIGTIPELSIERVGTGSGSVAVLPAGTTCPSTCQSLLPVGTQETLTATPANGQALSGWRGGCNASGLTCKATMNSSQNVAAVFTAAPVTTAGGGVTVTSTTVTGTLSCRTKTACTGSLTLAVPVGGIAGVQKAKSPKLVLVAKGSFRIAAHKHRAIRLKLDATGRKLARKHRLGKLTETVSVRTGAHTTAISVAKLSAHYRRR